MIGNDSARRLHVALVYNVRPPTAERSNPGTDDHFAEWDTPGTIAAVRRALELHHDVTPVELDRNAYGVLRQLEPDLVFNMAEGLHGSGREGLLPSMLDFLGVPYTGPSATTLNLCLHKARANEVLSWYGIPVPKHQVFKAVPRSTEIEFPSVVKPLHEGSSKGVRDSSLVRCLSDLQTEVGRITREYRQPALVESFLPGREFSVALLGNPPALEVLPIVEIQLDALPDDASPIYSYEAKWIWDVPDRPLSIFHCPAPIDETLDATIKMLCKRVFEILECADWCRVDLRLDESGTPHVLEVNPLPGILPNPDENSCFPKAARASGLSYEDLVYRVVQAARSRHGI